MRRRHRLCFALALGVAIVTAPKSALGQPATPPGRSRADDVAGDVVTFDDDGAWCWFQDARAIVHDGRLLIGTVSAGVRDPSRRGDVNVIVHDLRSGETDVVELHDRLERDDHDSPGLVALEDGTVLALYTKHGSDALIRMRSTARPNDPRQWLPERVVDMAGSAEHGVTYSNLHRLDDEGTGDGPARARLYNFFRGAGWDPNVLVSDDGGHTWHERGRLVGGPGRPYVRYASNGRDTIHFACTEQHPRDLDTSIYHGFLRGGVIHRSDGTPVGRLEGAPVTPTELTRVFAGDAHHVAWCSDIELDATGLPYVVYSVQMDGAGRPVGQGGEDCRYRYARWDGDRWHDHAVAHAGQRLYAREDDYTGLICLDPARPDVVYFSSNAHPSTGVALVSTADGLRHYEIFRGRTTDGGASWAFEPITRNSSMDNLRPMMPASAEHTILVWLRGRYTSMHDFDQAVVGLIGIDGAPR